MKLIAKLLLTATGVLGLCSLQALAQTTSYMGNGGTVFGGAIGNSTLTVTSTATTINFSLATTTSFTSNVLALYIDSQSGGFNSTTNFTDTTDNGRISLSGSAGSSRTVATFANGFNADFGIALGPTLGAGNTPFAGLYSLANNNSFGFVNSAGLTVNSSGTLLTFSVNRSDIGLSATDGFNFVASLISTTAFRSNETIGTSVTVPDSAGDAPNAGFTGSTTFANFDTYGTPVPEPATWLAGSLTLVIAACGLRRRSVSLVA